MGLKSDLAELNAFFDSKKELITNLERQVSDEEARLRLLKADAEAAAMTEIETWEMRKEKILVFVRIAQENTREPLRLGGNEARPDPKRLSVLCASIDPNDQNSRTAYRVVTLASQQLTYIERRISDITNGVSDRKDDFTRRSEGKIAAIRHEIDEAVSSMRRHLRSPRVAKIRGQLDRLLDLCLPSETILSNWSAPDSSQPTIAGRTRFRLRAPKALARDLGFVFGPHLAGNAVMLPVPLRIGSGWHAKGYMTRGGEQPYYDGLQTMLATLITKYGPQMINATVVDLVHYNATCLGILGNLSANVGNPTMLEVAEDKHELERMSRLLQARYRDIRQRCGALSVSAYNHSHRDKLPYHLLVIVNDESRGYATNLPAGITNLVNNSKAYGVFVVELLYRKKPSERNDLLINTGRESIEVACLPQISIPSIFIDHVRDQLTPSTVGTKYSNRHAPHSPKRSRHKRQPIIIPFAIDANDREISCTFEDDNFAAFIMGAAGSGKSTLLHTLISGITNGYHPDEVELWLVDFKRTEFAKYARLCPPHVRYLLLEESEELLFDLIDELTRRLDKRLELFALRGWSKLSDVPPEDNLPAIFIIIDEFAQVSQHLMETRGEGVVYDYTLKLENLLAKGRAAGLKFIFASQSYSTGVVGLTETARKQIRMRLALRNTSQEIRETLNLMHNQMTDDLLDKIASIDKYQTIFVRSNPNGGLPIVDLYRNMYILDSELASYIRASGSSMCAVERTQRPPLDSEYLDKHPVLLVDDRPQAFSDMIPAYKEFEKNLGQYVEYSDVDFEDRLIYPGVPCSFNRMKPLILRNSDGQNMVVIARGRDNQTNIALSCLRSWSKYDCTLSNAEVWVSPRNPIFRRYEQVFRIVKVVTKPEEMCRRVYELGQSFNGYGIDNRLIVIIGLPEVAADCLDYAQMVPPAPAADHAETDAPKDNWEGMDLLQLVEARLAGNIGSDEISRYNEAIDSSNETTSEGSAGVAVAELKQVAGDFIARISELLSRGPRRGMHVVASFNRASDFESTRIPISLFLHKCVFSLSRMDSHTIVGNASASTLAVGTFQYTDGERKSVMRPHLHAGVPNNGWVLNKGKPRHM